MEDSEFHFDYGILVDPVNDMLDTYMVQVDDHVNKKVHILPNTYKNQELAVLAGNDFIKKSLEKELESAYT